MRTLGIFVDRQALSYSRKLTLLIKCRDTAEGMGYLSYFIFPVEIKKVLKTDALFIRSRTDPLNISFIASKMAEMHDIPVIDDSRSIQICSDKVNMYLHLIKARVPVPRTEFVKKDDFREDGIRNLLESMGGSMILKEPSTTLGNRVKKVTSPTDAHRIAGSYLKMSDWIVAQEYIESDEDWKIGVLDGRLLYACRYVLPTESEKIVASEEGEIPDYASESVPPDQVPRETIDLAIKAASAIGKGLYSVDIKQRGGRQFVIEVNDNPSLESGEDEYYPQIYNEIISNLMER
ncbi:MAG TPA: RimK family alpha-L-glutamate ligase [Methanomassiliicoccales archaeon]